jgi:hypothetical protein
MTDYKPGSRWKSAVCTSEIVVVKPPAADGELACGGAPVLAHDQDASGGAVDPAFAEGVILGKRYVDDDSGIEVLGAKPGEGSLSFAGRPMRLKEAKPLPSSD